MPTRLHAYAIRHTLRIVGFVLLVLACVVATGFAFVRFFSIREIEVDGQGITIELDKTKLGGNLLFLPTERLTRDLLSEYPLLSFVRFEKRYPGTLVVHLIRRQAFVLLESQSIVYALDADGVVLEGIPISGTYTMLKFDVRPLAIGSRVTDQRVRSALTFLNALHGVLSVSTVNEIDASSLRAVMGNTNIFFPQTGDISAKADTLQTIVEGFRIKGALPTVIDLRFEKPIVTN